MESPRFRHTSHLPLYAGTFSVLQWAKFYGRGGCCSRFVSPNRPITATEEKYDSLGVIAGIFFFSLQAQKKLPGLASRRVKSAISYRYRKFLSAEFDAPIRSSYPTRNALVRRSPTLPSAGTRPSIFTLLATVKYFLVLSSYCTAWGAPAVESRVKSRHTYS